MIDEWKKDIIANIKFYREEKGWTQAELAVQANCSYGQIGNVEAGKSLPSVELLFKLATAFKIHPADILLRGSSMNKDSESFYKFIHSAKEFVTLNDKFRQSLDCFVNHVDSNYTGDEK